MKTIAAVLYEIGKIEVCELEVPPLLPGQALIGVSNSAICGTILGQFLGHRGPDKWLPHLIGHEGTGIVLEVGPGVTRVRQSDRVSMSWIAASGADIAGSTYGNVNSGPVATLATHAVVSENRLTKLPIYLSYESGCLLGCAGPTGLGSVLHVAKLQAGERIGIWGLGGVGQMAVIASDYARAATIMAIDPNEDRHKEAKAFGATEAWTSEAAYDVARDLDVAIVATGSLTAIDQALASVRPRGGRVVMVGNAKVGAKLHVDPTWFNSGRSVLGTWGGDSNPDRDTRIYSKIIASSNAWRMLSAPYRLEDVSVAFADFAAGRICRPLIAINS